MKVIAYDLFPVKDSGIDYVSLDELLEQSDIISLHCPLTEETRHMIDTAAIEKMKKGVVLVNTSRGGLIDAEALLEESRHGRSAQRALMSMRKRQMCSLKTDPVTLWTMNCFHG